MTLDTLHIAYENVRDRLPNNTFSSVQKSFAFSGAAVILLSGGNIFAGELIGAIAATVSLVDSIATGVIKNMYPEKDHLEWYENYAKTMGSIILVNLLVAPLFGSFIVNVVASGIFVLIADICKERLGHQVSLNASQTLVIV